MAFSEFQKAEDLRPCLKWVAAHQRWGVFDSRVGSGMCRHCSGRHQASPSEDLCCKCVRQVRPGSSKGQGCPCISIQGLGSQSVEKALGHTCCKVGGVESCVHEPGVMSGSLQEPAWAPEPRVVGCVPAGARTGRRAFQPTSGWELERVCVCHSFVSCWTSHGHGWNNWIFFIDEGRLQGGGDQMFQCAAGGLQRAWKKSTLLCWAESWWYHSV